MSASASTPIAAGTKNVTTSGRLFFLDLSGGRILSANPDGSELKTIILRRPFFAADPSLKRINRKGSYSDV